MMMKLCTCTMIKDEHRYLREFIDFYINLGMDYIILFEDINSKSHNDIVKEYDHVLLFKLMDIANNDETEQIMNGEYRIGIMWNIFYRKFKNLFDGVLFIDVDEFMDASKDEFLNYIEYIYNHTRKHAIKFKWQTMSANGYINDPGNGKKYSLIDTYVEPVTVDFRDINDNGKPMLFPNRIDNPNEFVRIPHGFGYVYNGCYDEKTEDYFESTWQYDPPFRIRHYLTKSWEEYCHRLFIRGEMDNNAWSRKMEDFFLINPDMNDKMEELLSKENRKYIYNEVK